MPAIFNISRIVLFLIISCAVFTANAQDSTQVTSSKKTQHIIGVKYDLTAFDRKGYMPWHLLSLEYTRSLKKCPLIARINYARRFNSSGMQFEADAYPVLSKKIYSYVNAGYSSNNRLFPKYRAGVSFFKAMPKAFETEVGLRLLHFDSTSFIYTASLGKYYKQFWFNLSTFLSPEKAGLSGSYFLKTRFYLDDTDFIMLLLGKGISPDDRNNNVFINSIKKLRSSKAELSLRYTIKKTNVLLLSTSLMKQEYEPKTYMNNYNVSIGYQKMF